MKSEVYEGGIRSPLLAHWPKRLDPKTRVQEFGGVIDLLPTVLEACGLPEHSGIEGRSLLPLLEDKPAPWPDRALVVQAHRGDVPVPYHNAMVRRDEWKLVSTSGFGNELESLDPSFELYHMASDPLELHDVAGAHPEVIAMLRADYDHWFQSVRDEREDPFAPPAIELGGPAPQNVLLSRQDWRRVGNQGGWGPRSRGLWIVKIHDEGPYDLHVTFSPKQQPSHAVLRWGLQSWEQAVGPEQREVVFQDLRLPAGSGDLQVELADEQGVFGPYQVTVRRRAER